MIPDDAKVVVLRRAVDPIGEKGWRQGFGNAGLCARDAIFHASSEVLERPVDSYWDVCSAVEVYLRQEGHDCWGLISWNDAPDRTERQVLQALSRTADALADVA